MKVIVVGGGQIGSAVASSLLEHGHEIRIIEQQKSRIEYLKQEFSEDVLILDNGTDPVVLEKAGIAKADVVAAVTGTDEVNLVASTLAKMEFGVPKVVARVNHPKNRWLFTEMMGVDYPVDQAQILTHQIVDEDILEED